MRQVVKFVYSFPFLLTCLMLQLPVVICDSDVQYQSNTTGFKGAPVTDGQYSFVVSVRVDGKHVNVGAIISTEFVLTEAYHYENVDSSPSTVTVKSNSVDVVNKGILRQVVKVIPHPKYNHPHFDLALIKVNPPFETEEIIKLPCEGQTWHTGTKAKTLAWGGFEESVLTTLKLEDVSILSNEYCSSKELEGWYPTEQLCVASDDLTSGLCDGDYGAPLIVNNTVLAGINIYNSCGNHTKQLDRFIDVSNFLDWISLTMM